MGKMWHMDMDSTFCHFVSGRRDILFFFLFFFFFFLVSVASWLIITTQGRVLQGQVFQVYIALQHILSCLRLLLRTRIQNNHDH